MGIEFKGTKKEITKSICVYMSDNGLVFSKDNIETSTPHAILMGDTSVHYYPKMSKWGEKGIALFCTKDDYRKLKKIENIKCFSNADTKRPYVVFVPNEKLDDSIKVLKANSINTKRLVFRKRRRRCKKDPVEKFSDFIFSSPPRRKKRGLIKSLFKNTTGAISDYILKSTRTRFTTKGLMKTSRERKK